ncbi:MAG: leucyl aminopeptidase [Actinobacteria bacterium]|uniref:leucyl aminopeptidase n=1 Tax=freshwater metagenome TaxID=449393 RepID=A0A6J6B3L0_9ZZZZ|nr:leucyl aminopeptidase [Rhodoluna sp.]MSZ94855.1 leucyl aminopeptidase [Actinomycetota bacterium]MTA29322.1 leucyl aminopeptidase [Actinomycetota bacterium]
MTSPKMATSAKFTTFNKNTAYVIPVTKKSDKLVIGETSIEISDLAGVDLVGVGVSAELESLVRLPAPNGATYALLGVGTKPLTKDDLRNLGGAIARKLASFKDVVIGLPTSDSSETAVIFEGVALGSYVHTKYKGLTKGAEIKLQTVTVISSNKPAVAALNQISILAESVRLTRDLVNMPGLDLYPESLAKAVQAAAKGTGVTTQIWNEERLAKEGLGGILGVGQGSSRGPRLVKLEYKPKVGKRHLALVGKGITFDTGGFSMKAPLNMLGMNFDMTGAASVAAATIAIAKLQLPIRVTAWLCIAENMVSGTAQRPNDVIKARNGMTIEVLNTDAEGRLVLADGLSLASEEKPDFIIDVATLTGAVQIALGTRHAGIMGDQEAVDEVRGAAEEVGELVWQLPMASELRSLIDSEIADIANVKMGNTTGQTIIGGLFLNEFVGNRAKGEPDNIKWAHLDIAATANNEGSPYGVVPKGATGSYVRTLVALAKRIG